MWDTVNISRHPSQVKGWGYRLTLQWHPHTVNPSHMEAPQNFWRQLNVLMASHLTGLLTFYTPERAGSLSTLISAAPGMWLIAAAIVWKACWEGVGWMFQCLAVWLMKLCSLKIIMPWTRNFWMVFVCICMMFMKGGNSDWLWSLLFLCMSKSVLSPRLIHYFGIPPL